MNKLLVTGGAGFIGSNFIRYWLNKYPNDRITNLDALTYAGHPSSTNDFKDNPNYIFIKGNILNPRHVAKAMEDRDIVVHFAAESHVDRSITGPIIFAQTNVIGTQVLLEQALKQRVKRFHHVSTDEVFGELPLSGNRKFNENTPYNPRSPYSASKASSDHFVRAYFHTFGLPITITNCSNNFGPYQDPEKFFPTMIINALEDRPIPIYGDGKNVRDWLYVDDHCRAIDLVINKGLAGETYTIGGQTKQMNNLTIAKKILQIVGKDSSQITFVADRKGHDKRYSVDWSKIHKNFGWEPQFEFEDYVVKTVQWYQENKRWWKPLIKSTL